MKKKIGYGCLAVLLLGLLIGTMYFLKEKEPVPEYVFSYAENQDDDYSTTMGGRYFAKLVEERSNGRIQILVQANGLRGEETEVLKQLKYGGVDFSRVSLSVLNGYIPKLNVLHLPYLYESAEHMWAVLDGEIGEEFLDMISETELIGLSWYDGGTRSFYTSETPIRTLEDMAGLKIRVQESDMMADMVECLGAAAVRLEYGQVYSGLERGIVQGAENSWPSYESKRHYEVAKYYTLDEHTRVPEIQVCSRHTWEKLSEDDRQMILECARESAAYQRKLWAQHEADAKEAAVAKGAMIIELSEEEKMKFREAASPVYEKYCGQYTELIEEIIDYGK